MAGIRFQRGNHVVADLDKALTFYLDVLGFNVTYILPPNPTAIPTPFSPFRVKPLCVFAFCRPRHRRA